MTIPFSSPSLPATVARALAPLSEALARTAIERDREGGLPKAERDLIRDSGLLKLTVPRAWGGDGQPLSVMLGVVRELARVDPALAHVFAFHHLMLASVRLYGSEAQYARAYRETAEQELFWGNALNPKDARTRWQRRDGRLWIDGVKSFCSGAGDSDRLIVSGLDEASGKLLVAMVPTRRAGIRVLGDWDAIGQRQTDSGTVELHQVEVAEHELLVTPGPLGSVFAGLRSCIAQSILVNVYQGIAEGAFAAARDAFASKRSPAVEPLIALRAGELWLELESAAGLTEQAAASLDASWQRGDALRQEERDHTALRIALAKAATTRAGLSITTRMFELIGARGAMRSAALDRYFRNLRTHTLHDPVDEKLRELGSYALVGLAPTPGFYS